jgi:hypothetical protein
VGLVTDQERLTELRNRINEAAELVVLLPVTRWVGSGIKVGTDTVVALPPSVWDAILDALDAE